MDLLTLLEYGSLYFSGLEHRSGHFFVPKAYQDLSLKSLVCCGWFFRPVHLGAWPGGSWLPWRAAPLGCVFVLVWFIETSAGIVLSFVSPFHLHNRLRPN